MAIHLFAPNLKKATLTPAQQAAISVGEIIVLGALIEAIVATTEYLAGTAVIDVQRLLVIAALAFVLAVMKGAATFVSAKAAPQLASTNPELAVGLQSFGETLLALEQQIKQKTLTPLETPTVTTTTTTVIPDVTRGNTPAIGLVTPEIVTPPDLPPAA